jgi:hypothetical protein
VIADFDKGGYKNAVKVPTTKAEQAKYPHVGSKAVAKSKTGLSRRDPKTSKKYLFSNPSDILNKTQLKKVANARPKYQRGER